MDDAAYETQKRLDTLIGEHMKVWRRAPEGEIHQRQWVERWLRGAVLESITAVTSDSKAFYGMVVAGFRRDPLPSSFYNPPSSYSSSGSSNSRSRSVFHARRSASHHPSSRGRSVAPERRLSSLPSPPPTTTTTLTTASTFTSAGQPVVQHGSVPGNKRIRANSPPPNHHTSSFQKQSYEDKNERKGLASVIVAPPSALLVTPSPCASTSSKPQLPSLATSASQPPLAVLSSLPDDENDDTNVDYDE